MNITITLDSVDFIALCPGYTDRLMYDVNVSEVVDPELLKLIPGLKQVTNPELRFWPLENTYEERQLGGTVKDCRDYDGSYTSEAEFLEDYSVVGNPVMISNGITYLLGSEGTQGTEKSGGTPDTHNKGTEFIKTFYPTYKNAFYGSIVFAPPEGSEKLEMVSWTKLANNINIGFCGCFNPAYPCDMKIIYVNGKSVLVVNFDCESG